MADADRELTELRREVVEARNQAIKTDNQVKNLSLDVKGFERRFDLLEKRTRLASLGAHVIVAVTIIAAAFVVHTLRVKALTQDLEKSVVAADEAKKSADQAAAGARAKQAALDQERAKREKSASVALKLVAELDRGREKEAIDMLDGIELAMLTPLEAKLLDKRVGELRSRAAEVAYKNGHAAQAQNQHQTAIAEYRKSLAVEADGHFASAARYYLATELWNLKRHEEAEPVMKEILKKENDKAILEEVKYLLAVSLSATGKRDEATTALREIIQRGGKFGSYAREQLGAMEAAAKAAAAEGASKPEASVAKKPDGTPAQSANASP
jgi:TolA-binding protein